MAKKGVTKTFSIDSEPVLRWPEGRVDRLVLKGYGLRYPGTGNTYTLEREKRGSVELIGWNPGRGFDGWRNVFSGPQLLPHGLIALAELSTNLSRREVLIWASRMGLLGLRPSANPVVRGGFYIPMSAAGDVPIHLYEPIQCFAMVARQAVNVMALWSALKKSYAGGGAGAIQSVVKVDIADSSQVGEGPVLYRTLVNGEDRGRWPIPKRPRDWRRLANVLLSNYIKEHIWGEIEVSVSIQRHNQDEGERDAEPAPDWNLRPTWRIHSALAAYYIELLMVMRRFRSCVTCGKDISHQRDKSLYCSPSSSCRSKHWHRRAAARKKSVT